MSTISADQGMDAGALWPADIAAGAAHMLPPHLLAACLESPIIVP